MTLSELKDHQWDYLKSGLRAGTVRAYGSAWNVRLEPTLGSVPLEEITAFDIEMAWHSWNGAWSTKHDAITLLSRLLGRAVKAKLIPENPVKQIDIDRHEKPDPVSRALEPSELADLFSRVQLPDYSDALEALAYTGMRFGEMAGLLVQDVDFEQGVIHVRRAASLDEHGRIEDVARRPKSRKGRIVPILAQLEPILKRRTQGKDPLERVFAGPQGGVLQSKNVSRAIRWDQWRDQVKPFPPGEPPLKFHDLRHTAVTMFLRASVPIHEVQEIMGHSTVKVTELYAHSSIERVRLAGARLSGYLEVQSGTGALAA